MKWSPTSWQEKKTAQQPSYANKTELLDAEKVVAGLPPLVSSFEIETLKSQISEATKGKRFLLQAGDCAERFIDCKPEHISGQLKVILQMSLVLVHSMNLNVIRVGRIAGQFAKPRSKNMEIKNGKSLPSYRGDLINDIAFDAKSRNPNPSRLIKGFERSAITINFIRALIDGGFADLQHPEYWDLGFLDHSPKANEFQKIIESIAQNVVDRKSQLDKQSFDPERVEFFTSHEGLHLHYEQAQTRQVPRRDGWYNLSCHFPWIGARTSNINGGHIEYFRGIKNPIGLKVANNNIEIEKILDILHPNNEPGRITLIHRYGKEYVNDELPKLIETVQATGKDVLFVCDPMHGNTQQTNLGIKTRNFDNIMKELEESIDIHNNYGGTLGGVHVEVCGQNVTECTGGARGLNEKGLSKSYHSIVDPRLNYEQAIELSMLIGQKLG